MYTRTYETLNWLALFAANCMQGIKWIRTKEASPERNLEVVRLGQPDMLHKLEKALENGYVSATWPQTTLVPL